MTWQRQTVTGRCESTRCTNVLVPGEAVRVVRHQRWCRACAFTRLMELPPESIPEPLPSKSRIYVEGGKFTEANFGTFGRLSTGAELRKSILSRRELERVNANDSKLKQAGDQ